MANRLPLIDDHKPFASTKAKLDELEQQAVTLTAAAQASRAAAIEAEQSACDAEVAALIGEAADTLPAARKRAEAALKAAESDEAALAANTRAIELLLERLPTLEAEAVANNRRELERLYKATLRTLAKQLTAAAETSGRARECFNALCAVSAWGGVGNRNLYWADLSTYHGLPGEQPNKLAQWLRQVEEYCNG